MDGADGGADAGDSMGFRRFGEVGGKKKEPSNLEMSSTEVGKRLCTADRVHFIDSGDNFQPLFKRNLIVIKQASKTCNMYECPKLPSNENNEFGTICTAC